MNPSSIPCNIYIFSKRCRASLKMYSLPFRGKHVSIICSINLRQCIPVLNNEVSPAYKEAFSLNCIFPLKKYNDFFNKQYPYNYEEILKHLKDAAFVSEKAKPFFHMISLQIGNIPVPYVACFSIYNHPFNIQNSCQKCNTQCINTIVREYHVK